MCISKILSYFAGETKKENVNLVIDIGNTVAKLAVFDGDKVGPIIRWTGCQCYATNIQSKEVSLHQLLHSAIQYGVNWLEYHLKSLN